MSRSWLALMIGAIELLLLIAVVPLNILAHQPAAAGVTGDSAALSFVLVGTLVAHRRPNLRMGWLMLTVSGLLELSEVGVAYSVLDYRLHQGHLPFGWLAALVEPSWLPGFVVLVLTILLYPTGAAPTPRWRWPLRWLGLVMVGLEGISLILIVHVLGGGVVRVESAGDLYRVDHPGPTWGIFVGGSFALLAITLLSLLGAWLAGQLSGYRRLTNERRVQQKWVISGAIVAVLAVITNVLPYPFASGSNELTISDFASIGLAALPVAMGIGILKYRLYEIDRLISRTLSYAILTALLAGTFIGLVALTTDLLPFSSTVGVAASTLAAAALFNPLRTRVQHLVDRRFNRARYDAEQTVSEFAAHLRDAVDLDAIQMELLTVVHRAVEPTHASIWIRPHDAPIEAAALK